MLVIWESSWKNSWNEPALRVGFIGSELDVQIRQGDLYVPCESPRLRELALASALEYYYEKDSKN